MPRMIEGKLYRVLGGELRGRLVEYAGTCEAGSAGGTKYLCRTVDGRAYWIYDGNLEALESWARTAFDSLRLATGARKR